MQWQELVGSELPNTSFTQYVAGIEEGALTVMARALSPPDIVNGRFYL
jgi:hypothetical protein